MKRFGFGILGLPLGYVVGAVVGYFLIGVLSTNTHDRSVEAAMTSAFVAGPLGAVVGFIIGFILGGRPAGDTGSH
jgi:uncharacterized membrane protein